MTYSSNFAAGHSRAARAIAAVAILLAISLMSGCGGRTPQRGVRVTGTVTVGGKPGSGATVRFFDEANKAVAAGTAGDDGKYVAVDVPRQALKVAVEEGAKSGPYGFQPPPPGTAPLPGSPTVPPATIPKKYQKTETSGLTVTVDGKEQTFDISLE